MTLCTTEAMPAFLTTADAARLVRLSPRTLEKHRIYGIGPAFKKVCGRVIYASADVLAWVEAGNGTSGLARRSERERLAGCIERRPEVIHDGPDFR